MARTNVALWEFHGVELSLCLNLTGFSPEFESRFSDGGRNLSIIPLKNMKITGIKLYTIGTGDTGARGAAQGNPNTGGAVGRPAP